MRGYMWAKIGLVSLFPPTPNIFFLQILNFNSKGLYEIASIFDM